MSRDEDKLIRQLSLLSFLLSRQRPFTAREVQESVEGYAEMSDDTFARRFHADRADLAKVGLEVRVLDSAESTGADEAQLYLLPEGDFRLPAVEFSPAEQRALTLALLALDGRFAYARPLRLALTAILGGRHDSLRAELDSLPVALAPDEDARRAGRRLSRLEDAVIRGKTLCFSYPSHDGGVLKRTLDPYSLFLIQGHWYVVGHDHRRAAIRTFRVGRIQGTIGFLTEKSRDFTIPDDYDPEDFRARPPWLIGAVAGTAVIAVDEHLSWWVRRLEPHVRAFEEDDDGRTMFSVPYADELVLLSWMVGLGGCAELLEPPDARARLGKLLVKVIADHSGPAAHAGASPSPDGIRAASPTHRRRGAAASGEDLGPIAPEHLARAMTLLYYLVDAQRSVPIPWRAFETDLGLTRQEVEEDLSLINLMNFGGGTYTLTTKAGREGVEVVREVMADTFSQPARLSPVLARALLLALDLLGDTFALEGSESLASVREKVRLLIGKDRAEGAVIIDDVVPPDPHVVEILNRAIRDRALVSLEYFTTSRQELCKRLVEPYLLFHSPDGWYLEAYCLKARGQRTFKLERIRAALACAEVFAPREEMDLTRRRQGQTYLSGEVATWATMRFHPRWRTYLEEQGTECTPLPDGDLEVRMPYLDERWVAQEVIRYLGDAVLVSPAPTRQMVKDSAGALTARYPAPIPPVSPTGAEGGDA